MIYFIYIYNEYDSEQNVYFPPALNIGPVPITKTSANTPTKIITGSFHAFVLAWNQIIHRLYASEEFYSLLETNKYTM